MYCPHITVLLLGVLVGSLAAQTGSRQASPASAVVAQSGSYLLTEQMLQQGILLAQIQAGATFSPSDVATLRTALIADFQKRPAKEAASYVDVAKFLRANNLRNSDVDYALMRY